MKISVVLSIPKTIPAPAPEFPPKFSFCGMLLNKTYRDPEVSWQKKKKKKLSPLSWDIKNNTALCLLAKAWSISTYAVL